MLGVWVNFAGVVAGGLLGTLLRGGIPQKVPDGAQSGAGAVRAGHRRLRRH